MRTSMFSMTVAPSSKTGSCRCTEGQWKEEELKHTGKAGGQLAQSLVAPAAEDRCQEARPPAPLALPPVLSCHDMSCHVLTLSTDVTAIDTAIFTPSFVEL